MSADKLVFIQGTGFVEVQHEGMRQTLLLMCEATVALDHCHRGGTSAPSIWDVARLRVAVQHRLCSLEPISPDQSNLDDIHFELCRLSALIYSDLILFPIPDHSSIKPPLLYDLGRALDKYQLISGHSSVNRDFVAWCTLLAATASSSGTGFRAQYIKRLEDLIRADPTLHNWEIYTALARRYLWWGYLLDSLAWEVLNQCGPITSVPFYP